MLIERWRYSGMWTTSGGSPYGQNNAQTQLQRRQRDRPISSTTNVVGP
jgi:hypothetical protein